MPQYDLVVSPSARLFPAYQENGVRGLLYLNRYYVSDLHFDHGTAKTICAFFVGSWSPTRAKFIGDLNKPFKIWGGGWEKSSSVFKWRHDVLHKVLGQIKMSLVFTSSRYNLNLLMLENSDLSNQRFFEVPASASILLSERNAFADIY